MFCREQSVCFMVLKNHKIIKILHDVCAHVCVLRFTYCTAKGKETLGPTLYK